MAMPRTETMPGYNHIELDEVHTPSRYFALLSFCSLGGPLCFLSLRFYPVASKVVSFLLVLMTAGHLSEGELGQLPTNRIPRTATWSR
jgi:hypothetical protein